MATGISLGRGRSELSQAGTTSAFLWVILPVAVPRGYAFVTYIYNPKKETSLLVIS
jgi:hypothetical protein